MLILEIAKNPDNLEELSRNGKHRVASLLQIRNIIGFISEAALSALTRVLREEWRKNMDLTTNIVCTLFFFSTYEDFHPVIIEYKVSIQIIKICVILIKIYL